MKKFLLSLLAVCGALTMSAQTNLLENGGFEAWDGSTPVNWKSTTTASNATLSQSTDAHAGSYSVCVANTTSNKRLAYKELNLKAGDYTFSFWVKAEGDVAASARPGYAPWDAANNKMGSYVYGDYTNNISGWQQITYTFTLTETTQLNLVVMNPKSTDTNTYGNLLVDDASLTTTNGGISDGGSVDPVDPDPADFDPNSYEVRTVDQFLAEKNTTTAYKVTGIVNKIANSTYGNFYLGDLDDPATEIYVYGVVKPEDQTNNKVWSELGVTIGDEITIVGTYVEYNGTPEIKNAIYVSHKSNGGKLNDIANTLETAYTVAEAAALLADANNDFSQQVYVKGKVCKYTFNSSYKNQNIYISDNGEETPNFEFYQCYGLDGEDIVSEDYLKLGDEVIGVGYLTTYNSQNEFSKGCHLVSINGKTSSNISEVEMGQGQKNIFDLQGRRVNNAIKGVYVVNGKKVIF